MTMTTSSTTNSDDRIHQIRSRGGPCAKDCRVSKLATDALRPFAMLMLCELASTLLPRQHLRIAKHNATYLGMFWVRRMIRILRRLRDGGCIDVVLALSVSRVDVLAWLSSLLLEIHKL